MGKRSRTKGGAAPAAPARLPVTASPYGRRRLKAHRAADDVALAQALDELGELVLQMDRLGAQIDRRVLRARRLGASWHDLGLELRMSGEGVRRRYIRPGRSK